MTAVVALIFAFTLTFIQCLRRVPNRRMCWGVYTKTQTSLRCLHWTLQRQVSILDWTLASSENHSFHFFCPKQSFTELHFDHNCLYSSDNWYAEWDLQEKVDWAA